MIPTILCELSNLFTSGLLYLGLTSCPSIVPTLRRDTFTTMPQNKDFHFQVLVGGVPLPEYTVESPDGNKIYIESDLFTHVSYTVPGSEVVAGEVETQVCTILSCHVLSCHFLIPAVSLGHHLNMPFIAKELTTLTQICFIHPFLKKQMKLKIKVV